MNDSIAHFHIDWRIVLLLGDTDQHGTFDMLRRISGFIGRWECWRQTFQIRRPCELHVSSCRHDKLTCIVLGRSQFRHCISIEAVARDYITVAIGAISTIRSQRLYKFQLPPVIPLLYYIPIVMRLLHQCLGKRNEEYQIGHYSHTRLTIPACAIANGLFGLIFKY